MITAARAPDSENDAETAHSSRAVVAVVIAGVTVVAAAIRIVPTWAQGRLGSGFWYDEAVYFVGAQQLWSGNVPYRDFVFVHPPGILVTLGPFSALAHVIGDSAAMMLAKITFMLIGAACAGLVAYLLYDYGSVPAVAGGLFYAVFSSAIWAETSVLMQPLLNLGVLCALMLVRRGRLGWAGVLLGLALTVKLWALIPLVVIAGWSVIRNGRRPALRLIAGASVAVTAVTAPFLIAAPRQMIDNIITFQLGRPRTSTGVAERIFYFSGSVLAYDRVPPVAWLALGGTAVAIAALPLVIALRPDRATTRTEPALWSALFLSQFATILLAPSFFDNYTAFAVPALALLVGYGIAQLHGRSTSGRRRTLAALGVLTIAFLAAMSVSNSSQREPTPKVTSALTGYRCVWAFEPHTMLEANRSGIQAARRCPGFLDRYAVAVAELKVPDEQLTTALASAVGYQASVREHFGAATRYSSTRPN